MKRGLHLTPDRIRAISSINFQPTPGAGLVSLNEAGLWTYDGIGQFNGDFVAPAGGAYTIDQQGYLVCDAVAGNCDFGEWYNNNPLYYSAQVMAGRTLRSDILFEYQLLSGAATGLNTLALMAYSPAVGFVFGPPIVYVVQVSGGPPTFNLTETGRGLGAVAGAFTAEIDGGANKLLISAQRVNANSKNLVISWYDRGLAAVQTVTQNWAGAGVGDQPLIWSVQVQGFVNTRAVVKSFAASDQPLAYGAIPA